MSKKEIFISALKSNEGAIYKIAAVYTNTTEDRNDLVQEIIYQLWRSFDSFNQQSALSTWIYRVALNVSITQLNKTKSRFTTVPVETALFNLYDSNSGEEERWLLLRQHIDLLNLFEKGIIILYLEDKSYEEISDIVGISVSNVGTRLSRIREKLKQQIKKQL